MIIPFKACNSGLSAIEEVSQSRRDRSSLSKL